MSNLRKNFERFCYKNRSKGIPNLMLYICAGNAVVYIISLMSGSMVLYNLLSFNRTAILHGEVWRLVSYCLTMLNSNPLFFLIMLFCYYSIGKMMEMQWGTFKFNLFYFMGVVLMDVYALIFGMNADVYYLNMSLFLSYATMFPQAGFLLFFIIPVKAWIFGLFDLLITLAGVLGNPFPYNLFPLVALANYFLFFGADVLNLIPLSWRRKLGRKGASAPSYAKGNPKVIIFTAKNAGEKTVPAYTHKCTVCSRTDVSNPELEFRYCSKCNGYYCYCEDHISNHEHIL